MNTKHYFFIVAAVILMAAGCRTTPSPVLSASPKSLNFSAAGDESVTFEVTSNVFWTISGQHKYDWIIEVSPDQGLGNATVTVKAKANPENATRESELTITATDVPPVTVGFRQGASTPVNIKEIGGVTAPAAGGKPVTAITETNQYVGKVTWTPSDNPFIAGKTYTATITMTEEPGFTLMEVAANYFTVEGAEATNPAGSGVITAKFPTIPDGSKDAPFLVATVADLQRVGKDAVWALDKHYLQTANIDMSGVPNWTPIGDGISFFTGSYDGGGYSINKLKIPSATTNQQGLFAVIVGGTVRNVALRNVSIISTNDVVGGIASASLDGGTIENCYVSGTISGRTNVGGISGYNQDGLIQNCYTTCDVTGSGLHIGGIAGTGSYFDDSTSKILRCYATGEISGGAGVGGVVGINFSSDVTFERCVALNPEVFALTGNEVGRMVCNINGNMNYNYARTDMKLKKSGVDADALPSITGKDGENVSVSTTYGNNNSTWWIGTADFSNTLWSFANGRLPHLKTTTGEAFKETQTPAVTENSQP